MKIKSALYDMGTKYGVALELNDGRRVLLHKGVIPKEYILNERQESQKTQESRKDSGRD